MSKQLFFEAREDELSRFVTEVEGGEIRALGAYAQIKKMKDYYDQAEKQIKPLALEEAYDYGEKNFEENGIKFELRNGATRYNYKGIPEWQEIERKKKECESKYKSAFLSRQKNILVASEDGEEIIFPEINISPDALIVKK